MDDVLVLDRLWVCVDNIDLFTCLCFLFGMLFDFYSSFAHASNIALYLYDQLYSVKRSCRRRNTKYACKFVDRLVNATLPSH